MASPGLLHFNLLVAGAGFHPHAGVLSRHRFDPYALATYRSIALTAERAGFDALSLQESRVLDLSQPGAGALAEPQTLLAALAALTHRLGLIAQVGAQHTQPYNTARRLASLDHVSRGRAGGWLSTRSGRGEAANFDRDDDSDADALGKEYAHVLRRLWDSWEDDAREFDKQTPRYVDIARVQAIDHAGAHFRVTGPIDIPRPPQGWPVLVRGLEPDESAHAVADADVVVPVVADLDAARARYAQLRAVAPGARILPRVTLLVSPSAIQRRQRRAAWRVDGVDWRPPWPVIEGAPHEVAQELIRWRDTDAADGFTIAPAVTIDEVDDVADYLLPELQRLGRARAHHAGATLREHLGLPRPPGRRTRIAS